MVVFACRKIIMNPQRHKFVFLCIKTEYQGTSREKFRAYRNRKMSENCACSLLNDFNSNAIECIKEGNVATAMAILSQAISTVTKANDDGDADICSLSTNDTNAGSMRGFESSMLDGPPSSLPNLLKAYSVCIPSPVDRNENNDSSTGPNMYAKVFNIVPGLSGLESCAILMYNFAVTCHSVGVHSQNDDLVQHSVMLYIQTLDTLNGIKIAYPQQGYSFLTVLVTAATCHNLSSIYTRYLYISHALNMLRLVTNAYVYIQQVPTVKQMINDDDIEFFGTSIILSNFSLSSLRTYAPAA